MTVNGTISGKGVSSIINIGIGRQLVVVVSGRLNEIILALRAKGIIDG